MQQPSYVCGVSDRPLIYQTLGELVAAAADRWGPREALVVRHQGMRVTYAQLAARVDEVAAGLLALGLEPRGSHRRVPRFVRFVGEFPMTVTGKVQKFRMRERMTEELSRAETVSA